MKPNSDQARDIANVVHMQTNLATYAETGSPLMVKGDGVYVIDDAGNRYIEAMAAMWCSSLGFSETRLAEVAYKQMLALPYYHIFNKSHMPGIDLAEKLIQVAPVTPGHPPLTKVLFQCSGSEANDTAIKLIWYYHNAIGKPAKKKIIGRERGYHGNTVASVSLSGQPLMHADFDPMTALFPHTSNPNYYRNHHEGESEEQFAQRMADDLEALILAEGPETVAAFFAEPVQGGGGAITPPATYFDRIQPILRKYDILFVVDEVICGFGRTGNMWGSDTYNLQPDMLSCAKALSASYQPISALLISERIFEAMQAQSRKHGSFAHGFTYSGHPVACAVALETLRIYEADHIVDHVRSVAPRFLAGLEKFRDHPLVGDVRGVGLIAAVEVVADKASRRAFDPAMKAGQMVADACFAEGVIVRPIGDRIAFTPPLIITAPQIDDMCDRFGRGLDAVWAQLTKAAA